MSIPPTQMMALDDLEPWDKNPRRINPAALARLYMSVDEYGLIQPIVVNKRSGRIVAGHQRAEVLRQHGVREAPCITVDWDEHKEAAASLALNAPYGEFDTELLRDVLSSLRAADYDIDLTALPPFVIEDTLATQETLAALSSVPSSPPPPPEEALPPASSAPSSPLPGEAGQLFGATLRLGPRCGPGTVCAALAEQIGRHVEAECSLESA